MNGSKYWNAESKTFCHFLLQLIEIFLGKTLPEKSNDFFDSNDPCMSNQKIIFLESRRRRRGMREGLMVFEREKIIISYLLI